MRTLTHARVEYLRNIEDVNELTLQDAVDIYLDDYFHRHKITSYTAACQILERELLSKLDRNQKITTITQKQVDDLRDDLHARHLYDENKIIGMIKRVFKNINDIYGWNCKPISRMYLTHVSYSDLKNKEVITYNIEQLKRFLSCCDNLKEKLIAKLLFFIGLRLGELRALKWSDINFDKRQIHIFRSATSKIGEGCTLIDPKTKTSIRTLRLPDSVFVDLVEYKNMNPGTEFIFESHVKTHLCLISETAIIKFLKKCELNYFDTNGIFDNQHYYFIDEYRHYSPKGNYIFAKSIIKNFYFTHNSEKISISYLRKIEADDRFYLKENDVFKFKEYLLKNKFNEKGKIGFIQMNASPFTNGHAYLIDTAKNLCDYLYVFVVEDNPNAFPFLDRFLMIKEYVENDKNIKVLSGSNFIGSKFTIPAYFDKKTNIPFDAEEDLKNFNDIIMPILNIDVRFMGEEPNSEVTRKLNEAYINYMNQIGKELVVVKRLKCNNCYISASYVREGLKNSDWSIVRKLVPKHVYLYLKQFDNKYDEYAKFN